MFFQFVASFAMFERKVMLETQTILQFFLQSVDVSWSTLPFKKNYGRILYFYLSK